MYVRSAWVLTCACAFCIYICTFWGTSVLYVCTFAPMYAHLHPMYVRLPPHLTPPPLPNPPLRVYLHLHSQTTGGWAQWLLIRSCHSTIYRYTNAIQKVKHTFWRTFKNYSKAFIVLTVTHRQNLEPTLLHTKESGAIFTSPSWVPLYQQSWGTEVVLNYTFLFKFAQFF